MLRCTVSAMSVPLFLSACFAFQSFKEQAQSQNTWPSGAELVPENEHEKMEIKKKFQNW
jgi:hypothetical protein